MGKLVDLKSAIATKLKANVTELADVDVIAHDERDVSSLIQTAVAKASGLAVVVMITSGTDETDGDQMSGMALRLESTVSVTLWATPILARSSSTSAPLTSGARQPLDVLEAIAKYLHNLNVFDLDPDPEGGPGSLRVTRWETINQEPPFFVMEIQAEVETQLS